MNPRPPASFARPDSGTIIRSRLVVTGIVQGVGFRPFIHRLATGMKLPGWVLNSTEGVVIEVEGDPQALTEFAEAIPRQAPAAAMVDRVERFDLPPIGYSSFAIEDSQEAEGKFALISPDLCICPDCLREMRDPANRRYRYPFINCTNCGPRFTIVSDVPYDRPKTTMRSFAMCPECEQEYHDPTDRRFHAQPNACPVCGPKVWLMGRDAMPRDNGGELEPGAAALTPRRGDQLASRLSHRERGLASSPYGRGEGEGGPDDVSTSLLESEAIEATRRLLANGAILAIKGLGGFHLACDATNGESVAELRRRKRRSDKPFAVMALDSETVATFCHLNDDERRLLESPQRPIVLLRRREGSPISPLAAPNNRFLGVMLPYTPLHYLILERSAVSDQQSAVSDGSAEEPNRDMPSTQHSALSTESRTPDSAPDRLPAGGDAGHHTMQSSDVDAGDCMVPPSLQFPVALVMTSGNLSEEPIVTGNEESRERLAHLADAFLLHDREIQIRCDDSVTRVFRGKESVMRRSRGYAPFPVRLGFELRDLLACGGELKSTFCITKGNYAFLSQHVGDLENAETLDSFTTSVAHFRKLFRLDVSAVACDLHPEYMSTRYAWELSGEGKLLPLIQVQHHHAHIASCMAENGVDEQVIGVSFDGTGYGDDGHLWGGEFLVCDFSGYQRVAHLKYLPLPGGEAAIKRPYRMALSHLLGAFGHEGLEMDLAPLRHVAAAEVAVLRRQIERGINSPLTSSMGRLFDAVSSLAGIRQVVNYEGQAAIELEMAAQAGVDEAYEWGVGDALSGQHPGNALTPQRGDQLASRLSHRERGTASPHAAWSYPISGERRGDSTDTSPSGRGEGEGVLVPVSIDPAPVLRQVVDDVRRGVPAGVIAARFHNGVAMLIAEMCDSIRKQTGLGIVALSGGVFQNLLLLERSVSRLEALGFRVLVHHQVPANDGAIALGQALIANRVLKADS